MTTDNTIFGQGIIGNSSRALANDGTIEADINRGLLEVLAGSVPGKISFVNGGTLAGLGGGTLKAYVTGELRNNGAIAAGNTSKVSLAADLLTNNDVINVQSGGSLSVTADRFANTGSLTVAGKGAAVFQHTAGGSQATNTGTIDVVLQLVAESPVPEPSTLVMLLPAVLVSWVRYGRGRRADTQGSR